MARSTSERVVSPLSSICLAVITDTGEGVSILVRGTAEPVTSMRPSCAVCWGCVLVAGAVAAWGTEPVAAAGVSAWALVQAAVVKKRDTKIFRRRMALIAVLPLLFLDVLTCHE